MLKSLPNLLKQREASEHFVMKRSYEKIEGSDNSILWLHCHSNLAVKYLLILKTAYRISSPHVFSFIIFSLMCLRMHVFDTRASECRQICQIKLKLELSFNQTAPSYFLLSIKDEPSMSHKGS